MLTRKTSSAGCRVLAGALSVLASHGVGAASTTTTYVANDGIDSLSCGARDRPCRSITQALTNAKPGTVIMVGPGRYGDIDGDGRFDSPGDERPQKGEYFQSSSGLTRDLICVVCITKPIQVLSWDGAPATIIDAGGSSYNVVQIIASNVTFGDVGRGFTVTGAVAPDNFGPAGNGLLLEGSSSKIIGNVARSNGGSGFHIDPGGDPPAVVSPQWHTTLGRVRVAQNTAVDNLRVGFIVAGFNPVTMDGNISTGNDQGVSVGGYAPHIITHTMVTSNGSGINVSGGPFQFTHNLVTSNISFGFSIFDRLEILTGSNVLKLNDIISNGGPGVQIGEITVGVDINQNNIYGNGFIEHSNCGVAVFHNSAAAIDNYWGSRYGPGTDPADDVGVEPACNGTIPPNGEAGLPYTKPFATQPFWVL